MSENNDGVSEAPATNIAPVAKSEPVAEDKPVTQTPVSTTVVEVPEFSWL